MLAAISFLIALFAIGWLSLQRYASWLSPLERLALAYGVGAGITTLLLFLISLTGLRITIYTGVGLILVLLATLFLVQFGRINYAELVTLPMRLTQWSKIQLGLLALICGTIGTVWVVALYWPPGAWDALAMWLLTGKLIAAEGTFTSLGALPRPFYPLNIPLQASYLYWLDSNGVQIIFPVYFTSLLLVLYANLLHFVNRTVALASTLFLASTPMLMLHATIGYANLPFAFYYVSSAIYLYRYLKEKHLFYLILSGVSVGFAGWTRSEAPVYFAINFVTLLAFSQIRWSTFKNLGTYAIAFVIPWAPWTMYARLVGFIDYTSYALNGVRDVLTGHLDSARLIQVLSFFMQQGYMFSDWGLLWLAFPVALILGWRWMREHGALITLIVLNSLALIYSYYSAGNDTGPLDWFMSVSLNRMMLHWSPLVIFYLGLTMGSWNFPKAHMFPFRIRIDPYLILLILFSLFAIAPLTAPGYFWGAHDGRHSVYFLFEFDRSIQDGIFYPRWAPDYTFGYGYPMFNIYAPGALYASESLHLLGFDFVTATKIVFALALVLSGVTMFGLVKRLTQSSQAAFLSGLAYIYIPYHIADLYVRAALEESVALVFLPLAIWGFYETVVNPRPRAIVITALAYGAMMFSHNGITLLSTVILGIWVLFLMIGEFRKRALPATFKSRAWEFIRLGLAPLGALVLGLGLVAIFFIPALLEYQYVRTDQWLGNYYDYTNHFVYLFQLFDPKWGFGISVAGPNDGMSFQLGVVPVVLALLSLIAIFKNPNNTRRIWIFFGVLALVVAGLMLGPSLAIWKVLPILSFIQFPWRLLAFTTVALAILAGAIVVADENESRLGALPTILLGALIVASSFPYLQAQMILEPQEGPISILGLFRFQQSAGEMTGSTAWVKDIPDWSPVADVYFAGKRVKSKIDFTDINPDDIWLGVDQTGKGVRANGERVFFDSQVDGLPITFNTFYYPGWHAYLTPEKSDEIVRELPITPVGNLGRIQIQVPQGRYWLILRFEDSPPRVIGTWISAASVLIALGILIWDMRAKRMQKAQR